MNQTKEAVPTALQRLKECILKREACIGVIGLGYVGIPVACEFARAGFQVIGLDIDDVRAAQLNAGELPLQGDEPGLQEALSEASQSNRFTATTNYEKLSDADIVLICVDTPVADDHRPNFSSLEAACSSLGRVMKPEVLVIIESTVAPGTGDKLVKPLLEQASGMLANRDFFLGSCPERVMPGKLLHNLHAMSRVCGGGTVETAETMATLYGNIVNADLDVASLVTAEIVKTAENTYRDVQIAFANEVALICEANAADVWQVRELVNKSPQRDMHRPGAGVGGHCIPKDPWLLASSASESSPATLIPAARSVNQDMPAHVANLVIAALQDIGIKPEDAQVAVLGFSYLENCGDTRNSPSASLVSHLESDVGQVVIHDPWITEYRGDLFERVEGSNCLVFMVAHSEYLNLDLGTLQHKTGARLLVDGRGLFTPSLVEQKGFEYWGIGRGKAIS